MACLQRASPALNAMLLKLHRAEKPRKIDHNIYESGSVHYHIQSSDSEAKIVYLSVSSPPLSPGGLPSTALLSNTSQSLRRLFSSVAEVFEPPKEGFQLTLRLDFTKLPDKKEDCFKAISEISSIQAVIVSSQLKHLLWSLGSLDSLSHGMYKPIKLVYQSREAFFIIRLPEKITAIFPMRFKDDSDVIVATAFFQELVDVGSSTTWAKAPPCSWSPIPPPELRGESFDELSTNGGFVSFDIFSRHVQGAKLEKTVWCLLNFYAYVKYHVKCTRGFIHRRMRRRLESLAEVMQKAMEGEEAEEGETISKGWRYVKKLASLTKAKILRKKCGAFKRKIMRIHAPIKILGFARPRNKWFKLSRFASVWKYHKLD